MILVGNGCILKSILDKKIISEGNMMPETLYQNDQPTKVDVNLKYESEKLTSTPTVQI